MEEEHFSLLKTVIGDDAHVISTLVGGMMNEAYVVESKQGKFVFYISTEQANEMVDRSLEKETQNIAFNLGITSKNVYFDLEKGIKINRYIEGNSINHISDINYEKVADLLYKFHSSKTLATKDYYPLNRLLAFKKEAEQFVSKFDDEFYNLFSLILENKEFLESQKLTIAHNDAQRSNIVKDPSNNYFLIDYEFAMNNDPIYDIGTFGNDNVNDGLALLKEYQKLTDVKNAEKRYALWRIDISLQWYLVALIKHYRGEGAVHGFNFLDVAHHFLENALEARKILK